MPAPRFPQKNGPQNPTFSLWWIWLALSVLVAAGILAGGNGAGRGAEAIPYSEFQTLLDGGKVKEVVVSGDQITGTLKQARPNGTTGFVTQRVAPGLATELQKHGVVYTGAASNSGAGLQLSWIIPPLLFVGIWFAATRFMGNATGGGSLGGLMQIGRSRA